MTEVAICVENLSKQYHIGKQQSYDTLRDAIVGVFRRSSQHATQNSNESDIIWALRDVSFNVNKGESFGIIGRNGAGKSTLLKILSQITEPTLGRAVINGRVGSLLEVGTGFHPELTGRENIFLNSAILGMKRAEINKKFDEIVEFAEIEKFLDTPVKRYSSGMYVRLAFAVAAHLDPEILLVDEVLAVGDLDFQKKCLGKMGEVANRGRTVIFVSHNLVAISHLCTRVLVVNNGQITFDGIPVRAIEHYLGGIGSHAQVKINDAIARSGYGPLRFKSIHCETENDDETNHLISGSPVDFVLEYEIVQMKSLANAEVSITIFTSAGNQVTNLTNYYFDLEPYRGSLPQNGRFICNVPKLPLRAGRYYVSIWCSIGGRLSDWVQQVYYFDVTDGDYYGTGKIMEYNTGIVFVEHSWK